MGVQLLRRKTTDEESKKLLGWMETNTHRGADKLLDSSASPLLLGDDGHGINLLLPLVRKNAFIPAAGGSAIGVVRGYNGSQVFNTTLATTDPTEPPHCGVAGGASYWLMYQPPNL